MKKTKRTFVSLLISGLMAATPAWALHEKSSETRIEDLSKRIEILEKKSMEEPSLDHWFQKISISGLFEAEQDKFNAGELSFGDGGKRLRPGAWNFEIAYVFLSDIGFGVKYEGSNDCHDFLPESRYGGIIFCSPFENTYLGLEYLYQEFDNEDKSDVVTTQLAFEF